MERSSVRLLEPERDVLPPQHDTVQGWVRNHVEQQTRWQGAPGRHSRRYVYDSNAALLQLRRLPAGKGWQQRLAEIPEWDGVMRFNYRDEHGKMQVWVGTVEDVEFEAQLALYQKAVKNFDGPLGEAMYSDPEDPPIVGVDIRLQGNPLNDTLPNAKPWGYRGTPESLKRACAEEAMRAARARRY